MTDSMSVLRSSCGSDLSASPLRSRTNSTTRTRPTTQMPPPTPNAKLMPWMLAWTGSAPAASCAFVTAVDTDTSTAVPIEPATWRNVLLTDVP